MNYFGQVVIDLAITVLLVVSLGLVLRGGLLSIGQAGFFAFGAYAAGLLSTRLHLGFLTTSAVAIAVGGAAGAALFLLCRRLKGETFMLVSLAFQISLVAAISNWNSLTGGAAGLDHIGRPALGSHLFRSNAETGLFYVVIVTLCVAGAGIFVRGSFGRALVAVRDDELSARSCGVPVEFVKLVTFTISAGMAGLAGSLYCHHAGYIAPTSFSIEVSFLLLTACILGGGDRTLVGAVLGAVALVIFQEAIRFLDLGTTAEASLRQLIYGVAIVAYMVLRPSGIYPAKNQKGA